MLVESRNTSRAFTSKYVTKTAVYGEKLQQNLRFRRIYDDLTAFVVIDLGSVEIKCLINIKTSLLLHFEKFVFFEFSSDKSSKVSDKR